MDLEAHARLRRMLGKRDVTQSILHRCFPVVGLIRRSVLSKTSLIADMPRADRLLLVELALFGPFATVDEPLYVKRRHDDCSIVIAQRQATGREQDRILAQWYNPKRRVTYLPSTYTRLALGYLGATLRTPMGSRERIKTLSVVLSWIWLMRRRVASEMKGAAVERVRGPRTPLTSG